MVGWIFGLAIQIQPHFYYPAKFGSAGFRTLRQIGYFWFPPCFIQFCSKENLDPASYYTPDVCIQYPAKT